MKFLILNLVTLCLLIVTYNIKSFFSSFISNEILVFLLLSGIYAVITASYFYYSYKLLFKKKKLTKNELEQLNNRSLTQCIPLLTDYTQSKVNLFKKQLLEIIKNCNLYIQKREKMDETLLSHFEQTELSYIKFSSVLTNIDNSLAQSVNNVLNRLNAFDAAQYQNVPKSSGEAKNLPARQAILADYQEFVSYSADYIDKIVLKMDQLQLEISKVTASPDALDNMEIITEIDSLISTMKLYK